MRQERQTAHHNEIHARGEDGGWLGLMGSMISFTNAATMFTMQQAQNAMGMFTHPGRMIDRYRRSLDSMSQAMKHDMDNSYTVTADRMDRAADEGIHAMSEAVHAWDSGEADAEALSGRRR